MQKPINSPLRIDLRIIILSLGLALFLFTGCRSASEKGSVVDTPPAPLAELSGEESSTLTAEIDRVFAPIDQASTLFKTPKR